MSTPTPTLKAGQMLVLHGPQGCGKTTLAHKIAATFGRYAEVQEREFECEHELATTLCDEPAVLIVEMDRRAPRRASLEWLKALITSDVVSVRTPENQSRRVRTPRVIVCTQDAAPYAHIHRAQLFDVRTAQPV